MSTAKKTHPRTPAADAGAAPAAMPAAAAGAGTSTTPGAAGKDGKNDISLEEFMAQAWAMEMEAVQRYGELADAMDAHNNRDVAAMFRKMAQYEGKHADQLLAEMGWTEPPLMARSEFRWPSFEGPETVSHDQLHYLMQPWHALELALAAEQHAERFFGDLARKVTSESVRRAALELQAEEREHVDLVKAWMKKVAEPDSDWAVDPDPPRHTD